MPSADIPQRKGPSGPVNQSGVPSPPVGPAGGDLSGTYPNPDVVAFHETGGPTRLPFGTVPDGGILQRQGNTVVGATVNDGEFVTVQGGVITGVSGYLRDRLENFHFPVGNQQRYRAGTNMGAVCLMWIRNTTTINKMLAYYNVLGNSGNHSMAIYQAVAGWANCTLLRATPAFAPALGPNEVALTSPITLPPGRYYFFHGMRQYLETIGDTIFNGAGGDGVEFVGELTLADPSTPPANLTGFSAGAASGTTVYMGASL